MKMKNTGKAKINKDLGNASTKETVDTPLSECEAENPLECRLHGVQALEQMLNVGLPMNGYTLPYEVKKLQGNKGYEIQLDDFPNMSKLVDTLQLGFRSQGWNLQFSEEDIQGVGDKHILTLQKDNTETQDPEIHNESDDAIYLLNEDFSDIDELTEEGILNEASLHSIDEDFSDVDKFAEEEMTAEKAMSNSVSNVIPNKVDEDYEKKPRNIAEMILESLVKTEAEELLDPIRFKNRKKD